MACNSCAKPYSLLRQEKGCPGCGFSYCSKCVNNKVFVVKLNAEAKVCAKCKNSPSNSEPKRVEPPDAYYRRLEVSNDQQNTKTVNSVNEKDEHILERLKKLKENHNTPSTNTTIDNDIRNRLNNIKDAIPSTSDSEIQTRLAKLRGVPISAIVTKPVLPPPDIRTEQEQVDDLLKQYMEKATIDTKYKNELDDLINNMELRVKKLGEKGGNNDNKNILENLESEDEEEMVKKIVEKIKAEAALEDDDISPSTNDELPFCEICNEDAKMRCLGCRYLFCKRCFMEHKDDDDGCNKYEPYEPKKH